MRLPLRLIAIAGATLAAAASVGPAPAVARPGSGRTPAVLVGAFTPLPAPRGYLNLHQCVYTPSSSATDWFTTVVPPSADGRFATATNASATPDPGAPTNVPSCGPGDGNFVVNMPRSGLKALDLTVGRYLNLHQCVYFDPDQYDHYTAVVTPKDLGVFSTGTNVSNTPDTRAACGSGVPGDRPVPLLSAVKTLDLSTARYLNLHQCVYYSSLVNDHFTTVVTPSGDGRFSTGTNVSSTPDPQASCGAGDGNFTLIPLLSGVRALPLI